MSQKRLSVSALAICPEQVPVTHSRSPAKVQALLPTAVLLLFSLCALSTQLTTACPSDSKKFSHGTRKVKSLCSSRCLTVLCEYLIQPLPPRFLVSDTQKYGLGETTIFCLQPFPKPLVIPSLQIFLTKVCTHVPLPRDILHNNFISLPITQKKFSTFKSQHPLPISKYFTYLEMLQLYVRLASFKAHQDFFKTIFNPSISLS